jgi:MoaA/NifB/PqqE/SkfB family radical SAM enzyme
MDNFNAEFIEELNNLSDSLLDSARSLKWLLRCLTEKDNPNSLRRCDSCERKDYCIGCAGCLECDRFIKP